MIHLPSQRALAPLQHSLLLLLLVGASCRERRDEPPPAAPVSVASPAEPEPPASMVAERVAELEDPGRDRWQQPEQVIELLELDPGASVVDLGAGTGYFLPHLSKAVGERGRVLALEPEETLVQHLSRRIEAEGLNNIRARRIPFDDPLLDAEIDRVLVVNTWRYIEDRAAYARKLHSALAPGGRILIVDFDPASTRIPEPGFDLSAAQVVEDLQSAGLRTAVVEEQLPEQFVVRGSHP